MRPALVVALCALAASAGAGGVLFAAETGGWGSGSAQTVLVREPLVRSAIPSTVVVSKPVLAKGFAPRLIFARRAPGVVTVFSYFGAKPGASTLQQGSGFVVDRAGVMLTAAHVIASTGGAGALATPAGAVYVQFGDGDRVKAEIVGWDPYDDVGVLHIAPRAHALVPVPLGSSAGVTVGQPVATIGSPFGSETSLSVGVVSGTGRTIPSLTTAYDLFDAIQTDAPVNQGNSGGPLLDAAGRAIGINAQIRSSLESGFEGVAFAVPIDSAKRSLEQLLASGHVDYAYLGLQTEDLTPSIARAFGYPGPAGGDRQLGSEARPGGGGGAPSEPPQRGVAEPAAHRRRRRDRRDRRNPRHQLRRRRADHRGAHGSRRGSLVHGDAPGPQARDPGHARRQTLAPPRSA